MEEEVESIVLPADEGLMIDERVVDNEMSGLPEIERVAVMLMLRTPMVTEALMQS